MVLDLWLSWTLA